MRQLIKPENTMQKTSFENIALSGFSTQQVTRQRKERQPKTVILFNKPYDVLPQFTDEAGRSTLKILFRWRASTPQVGSDRDSEGLLVLTNDGALQAKLTQPGAHRQIYYVQVEGEPTPEAADRLRDGVTLNDGPTLPAGVELCRGTRLARGRATYRVRSAIDPHPLVENHALRGTQPPGAPDDRPRRLPPTLRG